jgi:hypothetical protein
MLFISTSKQTKTYIIKTMKNINRYIYTVVTITLMCFFALGSGSSDGVDASDLETFNESMERLTSEAKESQDVTPNTPLVLQQVQSFVGMAALGAATKAMADQTGATKAELNEKIEKQLQDVIEPFDGLTLQDFSSGSEEFKSAMAKSKEAFDKITK